MRCNPSGRQRPNGLIGLAAAFAVAAAGFDAAAAAGFAVFAAPSFAVSVELVGAAVPQRNDLPSIFAAERNSAKSA